MLNLLGQVTIFVSRVRVLEIRCAGKPDKEVLIQPLHDRLTGVLLSRLHHSLTKFYVPPRLPGILRINSRTGHQSGIAMTILKWARYHRSVHFLMFHLAVGMAHQFAVLLANRVDYTASCKTCFSFPFYQ